MLVFKCLGFKSEKIRILKIYIKIQRLFVKIGLIKQEEISYITFSVQSVFVFTT